MLPLFVPYARFRAESSRTGWQFCKGRVQYVYDNARNEENRYLEKKVANEYVKCIWVRSENYYISSLSV